MLARAAVLVFTVAIAIVAAFGSTIGITAAYLYLSHGQIGEHYFGKYFIFIFAGLFVLYIVFLRLVIDDQYKFRFERDA